MSFVNQTTGTHSPNQPLAGLPDYVQAGLAGVISPGQAAASGQGAAGAGSDPRYVDPRLAPPQMQRYREMTIDELLLENRIVFLVGEINHATATGVIMRLLYLQNSKPGIDINLYINSPGGAVDDTLAIIDTMQFISAEVATYCIGKAMSGGAIILAAGQKGKRYALPHAKVMIHQPYGGIYGQTTDVQIQAEEILKTKDELNQMLADLTGQNIEQIAEDSERDKFFSANDAKDYGIVDEVIKKGPEEKKTS